MTARWALFKGTVSMSQFSYIHVPCYSRKFSAWIVPQLLLILEKQLGTTQPQLSIFSMVITKKSPSHEIKENVVEHVWLYQWVTLRNCLSSLIGKVKFYFGKARAGTAWFGLVHTKRKRFSSYIFPKLQCLQILLCLYLSKF